MTSRAWTVCVSAVLVSLACGCPDDREAPVERLSVIGLRTLDPVPVDATLLVQFSHSLRIDSVEPRLSLEARESGEAIPCSCAIAAGDSRPLEITPVAPLEHGTAYVLRIDRGVESNEVDPLLLPYETSFGTDAHPSPGAAVRVVPFVVNRHGIDLASVWSSADGAIFAGERGFALLKPGGSRNRWILPTGSEDEIWVASADGVVARWDGLRWLLWTIPLPDIHLRAIYGDLSNRPWLVGDNDVVLSYMPLANLPLFGAE